MVNDMNPLITVVVPSYNVEKYLDKCLTSFADERLCGRAQVIIVNDGSIDSTEDIASKYVERFPDIFELVNKPNGGHGSAVNVGIEKALGKYFRIVDGDDWVETDNFVELTKILEHTDSDLVVDEKREVNFETGDTQFFPLPKRVILNKAQRFEDICSDYEICGVYIMLHTLSVKTQILKENKIKLLEKVFYEDIEFIIKSTAVSKTVEFHDLEIYRYLVGNASQSVNYRNYVRRFDNHRAVTREMISFNVSFSKSGEPDSLKAYVDNRVRLLINTHLTIALIYNENRQEGAKWARDFMTYLKGIDPMMFDRVKKRYCLSLAMHFAGIDFVKLQKIKRFIK